MQLVHEIRINQNTAVSELFTATPGRVASVTCSVLQANLTNTLQIRWGTGIGLNTVTPNLVPAGFNGFGYEFGGPVTGELFQVVWGPGADVYVGSIRFWDEPIYPYGAVPLMCDSSVSLAPAATSAVKTANGIGAWLANVSFAYIADQDSAPELLFQDGTISGAVFQPTSGSPPTAGNPVQIQKGSLALANDLKFRTTNNGGSNMTYFARIMGYMGV